MNYSFFSLFQTNIIFYSSNKLNKNNYLFNKIFIFNSFNTFLNDYSNNNKFFISNSRFNNFLNSIFLHFSHKNLFFQSNSNITYTNIYFENSSSLNGAALLITNSNSNVEINKCYFYRCISSKKGGAIYTNSNSINISNCCFYSCKADEIGQAIDSTSLIFEFNQVTVIECSKKVSFGPSVSVQSYYSNNVTLNYFNSSFNYVNYHGAGYRFKVFKKTSINFLIFNNLDSSQGATSDFHGNTEDTCIINYFSIINCSIRSTYNLIWSNFDHKKHVWMKGVFYYNYGEHIHWKSGSQGPPTFYSCYFDLPLTCIEGALNFDCSFNTIKSTIILINYNTGFCSVNNFLGLTYLSKRKHLLFMKYIFIIYL